MISTPAILRDSIYRVAKKLLPRQRRRNDLCPEGVVTALYQGILEREPDVGSLDHYVAQICGGRALDHLVHEIATSPERRNRTLQELVPVAPLPNLIDMMEDSYQTEVVYGSPRPVYVARSDADIERMVSLLDQHRYYDSLGVWTPFIDLDKEITAAIICGLGARSCLELGCFTGPVLSLLSEQGVKVLGIDVSHLAFCFAYPNIRSSMRFGDILQIKIEQRFDSVLCMDVMEHLSPLELDSYIRKLSELLEEDGYIYLNAPMWGEDATFGIVEEPYLEEWHRVGDADFWRHWPCDDLGWPIHGHLVWAAPSWWSQKFAAHGFVRDQVIEYSLHEGLKTFLENAPGRRSLFVLRRRDNRRSPTDVASQVCAALAELRLP